MSINIADSSSYTPRRTLENDKTYILWSSADCFAEKQTEYAPNTTKTNFIIDKNRGQQYNVDETKIGIVNMWRNNPVISFLGMQLPTP